MPSSASVAAVSIFPSPTAWPTNALSRLFRTECDQNVLAGSPQTATILPRVTIMNAADPTALTRPSRAATRGWDHPNSSTFPADSQASRGNPTWASADDGGDAVQAANAAPAMIATIEILAM
jgi:hypothetical protein